MISPAPPPTLGLRHVALRFADLDGAERFFVDLLGYEVEWRPDPDNVYLAHREGGVARDNVALHRTPASGDGGARSGLLDHVGLMVPSAEDVDRWAAWLDGRGANVVARPRTHRDGARSLYLAGPEGLVVQIIHHPPIG